MNQTEYPDKYLHEEIQTQEDIHVHFTCYTAPNEYNDAYVSNHWHNSMEILYILDGEMELVTNNRSQLLHKNDFAIINSRDIHSTKCLKRTTILLLQIPYQFLKKNIPDYDHIRFEKNTQPKSTANSTEAINIQFLLISMYNTYDAKSEGFSLRFISLLYELLYELLQHFKVDVSQASITKTDRNLKRLETVISYVRQHYNETISLDEVAGIVALNTEYFCRFFKKYMGMTFLEYVNSIRLTYVCKDLMNTDYSITDILAKHGFTNYKLFMRLFKEKYGCTPKEKRKGGTTYII